MNWSDERYVKLYVRNTATWAMWPWQARATFPNLLRAVNGAGIIDTGVNDPLTALSVLIMLPREVVEVGVSAMLESGTLEPIRAGFLMPQFLEAQEARKTESAKKRDQRARQRDQARVSIEADVPPCPSVSPDVPLQPSPAQPPAQPNHQPSPTTSESADAEVGFGPKDLQEIWNSLGPPFPKCSVLSEKRKTSAKARIAEVPDRDRWQRAVWRIPSQPFLAGENNRKWVANFDWLVRPDTLVKLEERLSAQSETSIIGAGEIISKEAVF